MKDQTQKNGENAVEKKNNYFIDVQQEATETLKTLLLIEKPFGLNYLTRILKGYDEYVKEAHLEIETFGALHGRGWDSVKSLIGVLVEKELIEPANKGANTLKITDKGRAFLDDPHPIRIKASAIKYTNFIQMLNKGLRDIRTTIASSEGLAPYQVYSDYALSRITWTRPQTAAELSAIPGIGAGKAAKFGNLILELVEQVQKEIDRDKKNRFRRLVKSPSYEETKKLFLEGLSPKEIANKKKVKESSIITYLMNLHTAGEIDLKPWIESNVDSKSLYKGSEYFKQTEDPRMREAYEVLGLDYDILRFCKLYVSDVDTRYDQMAA